MLSQRVLEQAQVVGCGLNFRWNCGPKIPWARRLATGRPSASNSRGNHFWEQRMQYPQLWSAADREHALQRHGKGAKRTSSRAGAGTLSASASSVEVRKSQRAKERMGMAPTAEGRMP